MTPLLTCLCVVPLCVVQMITDSWYTAGNDKMVKLMLNNSVTTYMYLLNYTIQGLNLPQWLGKCYCVSVN